MPVSGYWGSKGLRRKRGCIGELSLNMGARVERRTIIEKKDAEVSNCGRGQFRMRGTQGNGQQ